MRIYFSVICESIDNFLSLENWSVKYACIYLRVICEPLINVTHNRKCSVSTPGIDRIIVDHFGLNKVSLLANTPPFAHNNQQPFLIPLNHGKS